MPAIASLEDLKAAQRDLLEAKDLNELKAVFKRWRRIGWKNVCKLRSGNGVKSLFLTLLEKTRGWGARSCNHTFHKTRNGVIHKKVGIPK
jgi:hypothetical protein